MNFRKYRYLNSSESPYIGRVGFRTLRPGDQFKLNQPYSLSMFDPTTGDVTDVGVDLLRQEEGILEFVSNLAIRIFHFEVQGDACVWVDHPNFFVMIKEEVQHAVTLPDLDSASLPVVEIVFEEGESEKSVTISEEVDDEDANEYEFDEHQDDDADEYEFDEHQDDPPSDWVDSGF